MAFDWRAFLTRLSEEVLRDLEIVDYEDLPEDVATSGWLGYPGATDEEIARAEARLGVMLPPSYRAFLKVSNGWRHVPPFITKMWSTEEIEWFATRRQSWIDSLRSAEDSPISDEVYFVGTTALNRGRCSKPRSNQASPRFPVVVPLRVWG